MLLGWEDGEFVLPSLVGLAVEPSPLVGTAVETEGLVGAPVSPSFVGLGVVPEGIEVRMEGVSGELVSVVVTVNKAEGAGVPPEKVR